MPAKELDSLVGSYVHLDKLPRAAEALRDLQKIASLVKPIMRRRQWHCGSLTEFWPDQQNLLGLNVNRGQKICLRLRYAGDKNQFMPLEHVVDTMLHELCHNLISPHDAKFHALWNELRDEYDELKFKGYTGEGFLSEGHRLGGRNLPMHEVRRQARAAAESRKTQSGSGQKLGGRGAPRSADIRNVIANAATRRQSITQGCGSGTRDSEWIANEATYKGFRTQAEEDQANDRAIAEALEQFAREENGMLSDQNLMGKAHFQTEGLSWDPEKGLDIPQQQRSRSRSPYTEPAPTESSWFSDQKSDTEGANKSTLPATTYKPTPRKRRQPSLTPISVSRLRPDAYAGQPRPDSDVLGSPSNPKPSERPPLPSVPKPTTGYPPEKVGLGRQKSLPRPPPPIATHPALRQPTPEPPSSSAVSHKSMNSVSSMTESNPRTATSLQTSAFLSPTVYVRPEQRNLKPSPPSNETSGMTNGGLQNVVPAKRARTIPLARISTTSTNSSTSTAAPIPASEATPSPSASTSNTVPAKPRDSMWTCPICTLCNPSTFLTCDACTTPRPCYGTIDDFSTISDLGPDAYPAQSPLSPQELPTATTPRHDSAYFNVPHHDDEFWRPAIPSGSDSATVSSASASMSSRTATPTIGPTSLLNGHRNSVTGATSARSPTLTSRSRPTSLHVTGAMRTAMSLEAALRNEIPAALKKLGWKCSCGTFMEQQWWSCSACGKMKTSS